MKEPRIFSNLGKPLSKVLEKLIENNLLRPLPQRPPFPNADPKYYCKYHQTIGHDIDNCGRLKHEIQDLIDSGKITDPETHKPNTRNNPLPNYQRMPPPNPHLNMINTGLTEEQVFNSFVDTTSILTSPKPKAKTLNLNQQVKDDLKVSILDI